MMVYFCTKFHENILNSIRVMERTGKVNERMDRQTDRGHDIIRPVSDGHIIIEYQDFFAIVLEGVNPCLITKEILYLFGYKTGYSLLKNDYK